MDPVYRIPTSPGTPLFPVSPERANRQPLTQSPSLPNYAARIGDPFTSPSRLSDVQGRVAQFNTLNKDNGQKRKENEAALKRAVVGREEAESETRRLRQENRELRGRLEEANIRDRKVGQKIDSFMEEKQKLKESQEHSHAVYEKEVRRARKEAFKSSSALVKVQEELKVSRHDCAAVKQDIEAEKKRSEKLQEAAFQVKYRLASVEEELEVLKQQMKMVEDERNALRTSLKEEEVARIAAEGKIPLPTSEQDDDEFTSPKKARRESRRESSKENMDPFWEKFENHEIAYGKKELAREQQMRIQAEKTITFMKMECQFKACACRIAERNNELYVFDNRFQDQIAQVLETTEPAVNAPPKSGSPNDLTDISTKDSDFDASLLRCSVHHVLNTPSPDRSEIEPFPAYTDESISKGFVLSSAVTDTMVPGSAPIAPEDAEDREATRVPIDPAAVSEPEPAMILATPPPLPAIPAYKGASQTVPAPSPLWISTTTVTRVPLREEIESQTSYPYSPGSTMTREEALEQIKIRRGRAQSTTLNGTPRKVQVKRDISAPTAKGV